VDFLFKEYLLHIMSIIKILIYFFLPLLFLGCAKIDPRQVDIEIPSGVIEVNKTELSHVLKYLGRMAEIYGVRSRIMIDKISDNTGTAEHTKAEIPYDITEMTASALNAIGENILFIPYRPDIVLNLKNLGYNNLQNKLVPSAIIIGGITEFDRGLKTKESSDNLGYETDNFGQEAPFGIEYMQGEKTSTARITIDLNMINIDTMSGLPLIQTSNTMQVHKGIGKKELGFTILGPTLGLKGEIKKVEGRHAALRLLVQTSVIQLIGKYLDLPYWRLINGAKPDSTVEYYVKKQWNYQMDEKSKIKKIQELLFLHGYKKVRLTDFIDDETKKAIEDFSKKNNCLSKIGFNLYSTLYYTVPLSEDSLQRRYELTDLLYAKNKAE
jgi:curli biogenesis system outer membrane secretion channel CsgG